MPWRLPGETEGEARERDDRRRRTEQPPTQPSRAQPAPVPVPTPGPSPEPVPLGPKKPIAVPTPTPPRQFNFQFWEPKPPTTPGRERRRIRIAPEGEPQVIEAPREFDPVEAAGREFVQFAEWWDALYDHTSGLPPDPVADSAEFLEPGTFIPQTGRQEDVLDAYLNLFWTYKNLEEYLKQYGEFDPEGVEQLNREVTPGVRSSATAIASAGTLDPLRSLWRALDQIHQAHPDNYTQYLASDAGRAELFSNALAMMYSPPKSEWSLITLGQNAGEAIDRNMADVPFLKPALINTVEIVGDPIFIGAVAAFPPAGLAAKTKLGAEVAVGIAMGEEIAEEVGLPGIVGALPGGLLGPAVSGFTRGSMRAALRSARHMPVPGEPATGMLIESGEVITDLGELGARVGERQVFYRGISTNQEAALGEGAFLTHSAKDAETFAATNARLHGGKPVIQVYTTKPVPSEGLGFGEDLETVIRRWDDDRGHWKSWLVGREGALTRIGRDPSAQQIENILKRSPIQTLRPELALDAGSRRLFAEELANSLSTRKLLPLAEEAAVVAMPAEESLAGARGGVRVVRPEGLRLLAPGELPFPRIAGGSTGPSIEGFRTKIRAHIERPEARDFLRLIAGKVADWVPLGGGKRLQEIINRMAVADEPALKAAFGWHFQLAEDNAARFMTMAPFRGARVPFIENEIGQIWVPTKASGAGLTERVVTRFESTGVGNLFRKGQGEWIAGGDVFESVMRGEKTYLERLTQEQVSWIGRAKAAMEPHISFAEQATGMAVRKRDVWWPRFAVDPERKLWNVAASTVRRGKPPALFARQFEVQQEAIAQYGIKYRPGVLNQMEGAIEGMQRITRDSLMGRYMQEEGILRFGRPHLEETYATELGAGVRGIVSKAHAREILTIIGPRSKNPALTIPEKVNGIARIMLTGSLDTGWGAIQLLTLAALNPEAWGEAMTRGFYNALVEPKQFYRWMASSPAAQRYALYGGDLGMTSELMEAARLGGIGLPRAPGISPAVDVATFPARAFINRLQVGFDGSLAYGRTLAFDSMAEVATKPGLLETVAGARPLAGKELHEELFRLARFTDTLIGQPKLGGVLSAHQHQIESGFVWFATRYTRSFLGTASYMLGRGYTPAQARAIMAKMLLGGMSVMSGLIAAHGVATGKSQDEIFTDIKTALNPATGKKFMSMNIGKDWYGLGGVYRSGISLIAGIANKENWEFEEWEEPLWDNPIVRGWRSRTAPITSTLTDFLEGEDFLGYAVDRAWFVDDPRKLAAYAIDKFAPITLDAYLQGGDHIRRTSRFIAEFFGLRTSPETAWEALEPVMNRVSQETFVDENGQGIPWSGLEDNLPAQDYVRNHPDVVAVTEGRVRPIRDRPRQRQWETYRTKREGIREPHAQTRQDIEDAYTSGHMDGSDYREQYGESQSAEFFELRGLQEGLGVEFKDEEAPPGTVNAALDAYYAIDLDNYRDKDTREPDWEAFFADRDAALAQVPEYFLPLVEQWLRRRETEVRRQMRARFESVVEPSGYFRMRENVALGLEINLNDLESRLVQSLQKEGRRTSPADVSRLVDRILNGRLVDTFGENAPSISKLRQLLRETDPALDAELFRQGFVTTVRSVEAQERLERYQQMWPDMGYFNAPLAADVTE